MQISYCGIMSLNQQIIDMSETKSIDEITDFIFEQRRIEDEHKRKLSKSIIFKLQTRIRLIKWRLKGIL